MLLAVLLCLGVPAAASAHTRHELSYDGAWDAGANVALVYSFVIPGEDIDSYVRIYRAGPFRFVGHFTDVNWRKDRARLDFVVTKHRRSDGRWLVVIHKRRPADVTILGEPIDDPVSGL